MPLKSLFQSSLFKCSFASPRLRECLQWRYTLLLPLIFLLFSFTKHPFYLSVTELKYKPAEKTLQVSVKMFTNDLEDAMKKTYKQQIDLINGRNKSELNSLLENYISKRLKIKVDHKDITLKLLGFEKEEDAIWTYLELENCPAPKIIYIENSLLYDYLPNQTNIVQVEIGEERKSLKVSNPDKQLEFSF